MTWRGPTYRMVDRERIDGAWCHIWRRYRADSEYYLDDLIVFADGAITCGERTDLAGLEKMLATGRLAVTNPETPTLPDEPSKWASRHGEPLTPEGFLLEVTDRIEALNERPTAGQRCWDAIRRFQQEPAESTRALLRAAYLAVPSYLRIYVLGDMDLQDRPLRILLTNIGEAVDGDGPVATAEMHQDVLDYFSHGNQGVQSEQERRAIQHADDPSGPGRPALILHETVYPRGWPEQPGLFMLRNDFPAQIVFAGESYASVLHGYWALSAADGSDRSRIRDAASGREAHDLGGQATHRSDWPNVRLAVMAELLRAKFTQHPELAQVLVSTGDARISYTGLSDSPFWRDIPDARGRNWMGRLLELTRSELVAQQLLRPEEPRCCGSKAAASRLG
ncbi:NADAR family protein [Streptomyces sp. NBC_00569]|uniref:NADAR family protein n=1 Tax=Streptomyces sp. NBC_00569 TaxID=2975780 RepID=UPI002E8029E7|nr:NADAR family protein [Streptomyces sp. NBC_00569]WUB92454.1 NADAR family protein [Streptomyces sp. NBC_00569]